MSVKEKGYLTTEEVRALPQYPTEEDFKRGPMAVIECPQEIPCNPCETSCRFNAIHVGKPITTIPQFTGENCTGCAVCVTRCPGLAIFVVDKTYSEDMATVTFPHEYRPLPKKGDIVDAVNRQGQFVCKAEVLRVLNPKAFDHTSIVTLIVPQDVVDDIRGMKRLPRD